jgi:hypothetical protein
MVGCLFPFILLLVGGGIGSAIGGSVGAYYGGAIGLVAGTMAMVALLWALAQAKQR